MAVDGIGRPSATMLAVRVLLTGATGFVGSFVVPALLDAGHEVVAFVRDPAKAARTLAGRGVDGSDVDVRVGDILDRPSIEAAVAGCDAAIHTAAAIGVTSGGKVSVSEQNVSGTANVVGAALDAGCDPVVHVSSVAVFVPPDGPVITTESRLATPRTEYGRSKVEAERAVRAQQDAGAPIVIVYPGGVYGPDQPTLDAAIEGIAGARRQGWPKAPGGTTILDVRDLAAALVAAVEPGRGPRRLLLGGRFLTWAELGLVTDELLGVKARRVPLPKPVLYGAGSLLDLIRKVRPIAYPLTRDAAEFMATMVPTDDETALRSLGITLRPLEETLTDTLRWLAAAGHLSPAQAGKLVP